MEGPALEYFYMIHRGGWERKSYELKDLCAHIYMTGGATSSDIVNAKSFEEDPRTIGGLVSTSGQ